MVFFKTMPEWPHEYIVENKVEANLFIGAGKLIRVFGYECQNYKQQLTYFEEDGLGYWTMVAPIEETTLIKSSKKVEIL